MITVITAPPAFISPEEHAQVTSSTPASFTDIPPVLRWSDEVEIHLSSVAGGWESWNAGKARGKLYVTETSVAFIPNPPLTPGFDLHYPALTLHALTPASSDGPAHLYCQVDESDTVPFGQTATASIETVGLNGHAAIDKNDVEAEDDEDHGGEFTEMREIRIYLTDASKLESLFQALSQCSALHASLMPNGEPQSFFGDFAEDDENDGQWDDAPDDDAPGGDGQNEPGRVKTHDNARMQLGEAVVDDESETEMVDQMERFLTLVDWGDVKKPEGWDEN
ncbi:hypothetical protein L204_105544 [Cryptococcus depauperatus]